MISKIETVTFATSVTAVLSGLTVSFFTPNRIGEYAGRVGVLSPGNRIRGTMITILESSAQLVITIIGGCLSFIWYGSEALDLKGWSSYAVNFACISVPLVLLFVYLNLNYLIEGFSRIRWLKKAAEKMGTFEFYTSKELLKVLSLSLARYLVFCFQFYLLIVMFGLSLPLIPSLLLISLSFFVMTVVPTVALTELTVRGAVTVYFFSALTMDGLPVLHAAFALWLINLVLPSVAGAILIMATKWRIRA